MGRFCIHSILIVILMLQYQSVLSIEVEEEDNKKTKYNNSKKNSKLINHIIKSYNNKNYYSVLKLQPLWMNDMISKIPYPISNILPLSCHDEKSIKKSYRKLSKKIHPDKNNSNKNNNSIEAFIALEESTKILLNNVTKKEYDNNLRMIRNEVYNTWLKRYTYILNIIKNIIINVRNVFKIIIGPFLTPFLIMFSVLI